MKCISPYLLYLLYLLFIFVFFFIILITDELIFKEIYIFMGIPFFFNRCPKCNHIIGTTRKSGMVILFQDKHCKNCNYDLSICYNKKEKTDEK